MGKHHKKHSIPVTFEKGVAIREVRPNYWLVDFMMDGKRTRKAYGDIAEAKKFVQDKVGEIRTRGTQALDLPDHLRAEALEAVRRLKGTGKTILEVIDDYLVRHPTTAFDTVELTCERYLTAMRQASLRPLSIYDKQIKFGVLCQTLGMLPIGALDEDQIETFANSREGSKTTKEAYASIAQDLVNFYRRGNRLKPRSTHDESAPATFDAQTVTKIMATADQIAADIAPGLAVLFFAGLRPHEALRLTWEQIDMEANVIRLSGADTKTRAMRNVEIGVNLRAWLEKYRATGTVLPGASRYRDQREKVMRECKLSDWPVDVPRHTFATMHYNTHQDAAKTMAQIGHFGKPDTFVRHYKGVPVSAADAAAYWKIMPKKGKAKKTDSTVVSFVQVAS